MRVIDLLNKIANGEEVPREIRIGDKIDIFYYQDYIKSYKTYDNEYLMCEYLNNTDKLNDEIEIIEEDKKIEKIPYYFSLSYINSNIDNKSKEGINKAINEIYDKVNEIIDKLNEIGETKCK